MDLPVPRQFSAILNRKPLNRITELDHHLRTSTPPCRPSSTSLTDHRRQNARPYLQSFGTSWIGERREVLVKHSSKVANCGLCWIGPRRFPRCSDPDQDIHCSYCCPERYVICLKVALGVEGSDAWVWRTEDGLERTMTSSNSTSNTADDDHTTNSSNYDTMQAWIVPYRRIGPATRHPSPTVKSAVPTHHSRSSPQPCPSVSSRSRQPPGLAPTRKRIAQY